MNPHRILVVEDEAIVAMDIQDRLASLGYQLAGHTGSGQQALELTKLHRPDLVLMDIRLQGGMDGVAAAEQIRRFFNTPVIFLTAYSEDTTLERAKLAEPYAYLLKPFDDRELKSAIEIAFYKHRAEQEIRRLSRLYNVLCQVNQAIVRIKSREELLPAVCRIMVERGELALAWIGWLDPATARLQPIAQFGDGQEFLSESEFYADDRAENRRNPGLAVKEGRAIVCQEGDRRSCHCSGIPACVRQGFQSCGSFPLRYEGQICGALNVYAGEPAFFGESEKNLMEEVAFDLSFALDKFASDAQGRLAQQALIESEQRFRVLFEKAAQNQAELAAIYDSTPLMLCLVNAQQQVERMNRAMTEFAGEGCAQDTPLELGKLLGCVYLEGCAPRSTGVAVPECELCALKNTVAETLKTGQTHRQVEGAIVLVREGRRREIRVSISTAPVRIEGQAKVLLCLEDITARKQLEAQYLQAQKMEAIGQLAGGVAHDFNNILGATLLQLELLKAEPQTSAMTEALRELEQGARRAADLTRQLLLFSRRQVMQTKRLDMNKVVENMLKMLQRLLGEHIAIEFKPTPAMLAVEGDTGMIEQVIMNLCVNARDAMPKGGRLSIGLHSADLRVAAELRHADARLGRFVCLQVTDNGSGMEEATLKRIFEPFFTTKEAGKGTGLGLATVYGIVRQHQGWVEVTSALGRGTTFHLFLPAAANLEPVKTESPPTPLPGGTETILLVEDDERVRRVIHMTLSRFGYTVIEARNGIEALRIWEGQGSQVDMLFSDMVMPEGMTGLELADRLRVLRPQLKVLITSGYSADLLRQGGQLPANIHFLPKPYNPATLGGAVRKCLDDK